MEKISVVIPCYNEEGNISLFYEELKKSFDNNYLYELIFVNDGSKDNTMLELEKLLVNKEAKIKIIDFSRNFGKEAAMYAGLKESKGDYTCIIDADLQQNPKEIIRMLDFIKKENCDAVALYQTKRKESFLITKFKSLGYKFLKKVTKLDFYPGASDFRLLKKKVVLAILELSESSRFSKGIFAFVGFDTRYLPYEANKRINGKSSFTFVKLVRYAIDGLVSFTSSPLRIATYIGLLFSSLSFFYLFVVVIQKLFFGINIPGYPTIIVLILLTSGIQFILLGILGEYLAKTYDETKRRPIYIAKNILTNEVIYDK